MRRQNLGPGEAAPSFTLPVDGGGAVSLQSFQGPQAGRSIFIPKDDTSGCTKEAIDFNQLKGEFAKAGAAILGVSPDSAASHAKFKGKHGLDIALASDETKAMLQAYGVWVEKSMYGRKYMGVERTTFLIDAAGVIARGLEQGEGSRSCRSGAGSRERAGVGRRIIPHASALPETDLIHAI